MQREEALKVIMSATVYTPEKMEALETLIPDLRESKDEMIRKELIEKISNLACGCFISQEQKQNFIAYLEKQKEQKPVKWSEEDEERLESIIESYKILCKEYKNCHDVDFIPYDSNAVVRTIRGDIDFLKSLRPQKLDASNLDNFDPIEVLNKIKMEWPMAWEKVVGKQEWSEVDILTLDSIISIVEDWESEQSEEEKEYYGATQKSDFLKFLRPPFKDREMKLKILKYLSTRCSSLEFEEAENYLNNLCPSWKPSEEQMKALWKLMKNGIYLSSWGELEKDVESLYNDLEKL